MHRELHKLIDALPANQKSRFFEKKSSNFDFRVDRIAAYVGRLKYIPASRTFDVWMFPGETLAKGGGDCEDLAFVMAALLNAAGISSYCVRVAMGKVTVCNSEMTRTFDHAWVVYQNEDGGWEILEPLAVVASKISTGPKTIPQKQTVEYLPLFVFNSEHLWRIRSEESAAGKPLLDYLHSRDFWNRFKPAFAAGVHKSIFDDALSDLLKPDDLTLVKRASFWLDVNVLAYDPRDHFDFAYINEGWGRIQDRLATGKIKDFGLATHTVADFYAHTLYGEFGKVQDGSLGLYDRQKPEFAKPPAYDFSHSECELRGCNLDKAKATEHWQGQIISGQWWRWYTTFPDDLENTQDFKNYRRCLPDHDFVAVDSSKRPQEHWYDQKTFLDQYNLRYGAAASHVRSICQQWQKDHQIS